MIRKLSQVSRQAEKTKGRTLVAGPLGLCLLHPPHFLHDANFSSLLCKLSLEDCAFTVTEREL